MLIGLPFVSALVWLLVICQKRDAQSASVHGDENLSSHCLSMAEGKAEMEGESLLRCCSSLRWKSYQTKLFETLSLGNRKVSRGNNNSASLKETPAIPENHKAHLCTLPYRTPSFMAAQLRLCCPQ